MSAAVYMLACPAVVLGIDQGAHSGYSIWVRGKLERFGVATTAGERRNIVTAATMAELSQDIPLIVCFEDHSTIPLQARTNQDRFRRGHKAQRSTASILGMGAARGRWEEQLDEAAHPKRRTLAVEPSQWRKDVLGLPKYTRTESAKLAAVAHCKRWTPVTVSHDCAEALCIGYWATCSPQVRKMIPITWRRRHV